MPELTKRELLEKRATCLENMKDLQSRAKKEGRELKSDEMDQVEKWDQEFNGYTAQIKEITQAEEKRTKTQETLDKLSDYEAMLQKGTVEPTDSETRGGVAPKELNTASMSFEEYRSLPKAERQKHYGESFEKFLRAHYRAGMRQISPVALLPTRHQNVIRHEFLDFEKRNQVVGTPSAGGYLVPEAWSNDIIEVMKAYGGMLETARVIPTSTGGQWHEPKYDETSVTGALIAEVAADSKTDITFSEVLLDAYTYTSRLIAASYEMLQDEEYDLRGLITRVAGIRIGRILNTHLTTGTGTGQPNGVVTGAAAGHTASSSSAFVRGDFLNLIHSVDPAYRQSPNFRLMFNDNTLLQLKLLAIGSADDRPLWVPSMRDGAPDMVEGVPYVINQDMASIGSTTISALCGDFDKYYIRQVRGVTMASSEHRYIEERRVVWFAYARFDGDIADSTAIKKLTHPV